MGKNNHSNPNRTVNLGFAISNKTHRVHSDKIVTPEEAERDLIAQIVKMEQSHHSQMPGANRVERRLLARKVRRAALRKQRNEDKNHDE